MFFLNTGRIIQHRVENIFHFEIGELPITYFSMPLFNGEMKETFCDPIVEQFLKKLVGWKGDLLSQESKIQVIKSILQRLSIYFMLVFKIPRKVLDRLT